MSNLRTLVFFATPPHDCSYLPDREATTMFVDPRANIDKKLYSQLTALGFRRRSQRRVMKKNADLDCDMVPARFTEEYYTLYARYINERHSDGDMYPPSREQFSSFLVEGATDSWFLEMRLEGKLVGLAAVDVLDDGLSAIYTVFAPELEHRSPGTFAILWQIEEARRQGLPHLYLGYWIKECRKMNYKTRFQPIEALRDGHWRTMDDN